ncbi:MAG TPA: hypothetical protein VHF50_00575 [Solirubrobacterales bacterium]|nr:hypothetical protein [Solirubrobacterales bacterium]
MRAVGGRRTVVGIGVLALLCASPAASAGARGPSPVPLIGEFHLRASKGYELNGFILGRIVALEATSGNVSAEYVVAGKRTGGRLEARFGRLGRLALAFRPADQRERCKLFQLGTYRGTIEFSGERGYTRVAASSAKGIGLLTPADDCAANAAAARRRPTITTHLHAVAKRGERSASVSVFGVAGFGRHFLLASREERREKMTIVRYAHALVGGSNAFVASGPGQHPAFAVLRPPKPFAGSAVFEERGEFANAWTGDLSAWLPGAGRVPLAGPTFSSSLCRKRANQPGCALDPTVRRPLSTLQGSGSQSQLLGDARLSWSRYVRNSASSAGSTP